MNSQFDDESFPLSAGPSEPAPVYERPTAKKLGLFRIAYRIMQISSRL
jgi:hypothetical protein